MVSKIYTISIDTCVFASYVCLCVCVCATQRNHRSPLVRRCNFGLKSENNNKNKFIIQMCEVLRQRSIAQLEFLLLRMKMVDAKSETDWLTD